MKRDKLAEELTTEIAQHIVNEIAIWAEKKCQDGIEESVILASAMTSIIMTYEIMAKNIGFEEHGYDCLHKFIMRARNRKSET